MVLTTLNKKIPYKERLCAVGIGALIYLVVSSRIRPGREEVVDPRVAAVGADEGEESDSVSPAHPDSAGAQTGGGDQRPEAHTGSLDP